MWGWLELTARRPPAARTASIAASSRNGAGSHSRLPCGGLHQQPALAHPDAGLEPTIPIRPGSTSRTTEWQPSAASCAIVVQRWPAGGTHWRSSSHSGQRSGGDIGRRIVGATGGADPDLG